MSECVPIEDWPARLERVIAERCTAFHRAIVVRETSSTQDAARSLNGSTGDVVVAWRQTSGRGRLGRRWQDTGEDGVAVTFVLPRGSPEQLAIASAIGAAYAIEELLKRRVGVKWPNDIVVNGRKLAGILIEQTDSLAHVGIGINVSQTHWADEVESSAISMAQLGCDVDRIDVLCELVPKLEAVLQMDDKSLTEAFAQRDVLSGTQGRFGCGQDIVAGTVRRIDPMRGLAVETESGERWLPAATTTVLSPYPIGAASPLLSM